MRKKTKEYAGFQANDVQQMLLRIDEHIYSEIVWDNNIETVKEFKERNTKFFNVREALKDLLDELLKEINEYKW